MPAVIVYSLKQRMGLNQLKENFGGVFSLIKADNLYI